MTADAERDPEPASRRQERAVQAVAAVASFLTPFMGSSINVALPALGREFGADAVTLSWVSAAFLLAAVVFLVPLGRAADIYGRKRFFTGGLLVYSATSLLCALAPSASFLVGTRVLQGMGGAMIFGTSIAILTSVIPASRRGAALGVNTAAVYLGLSLGPFVGGVVTQQLGWRRLFELNALLALAAAIVAPNVLHGDWAGAKGEGFDLRGSALYAAGVAGLMYGLSRLSTGSGAVVAAAGVVALGAFVRWELRARWPVLDIRLLRGNRTFAMSNVAALVNYSATYAASFLLSLYLQYVHGSSAQAAGAILVAQPVVQTALSPVAGRLSDRTEPRIVASFGMALTAAGLGLFALLSEGTPILAVIAGLVLLGCGFGFFSSPNTNAVMGAVERRFYGVAAAMLATMRLSGQMVSMATATLLLGLFVGRRPITPAEHAPLLASTRVAFAVFAALCLAGTFASLARGPRGSARRRGVDPEAQPLGDSGR